MKQPQKEVQRSPKHAHSDIHAHTQTNQALMLLHVHTRAPTLTCTSRSRPPVPVSAPGKGATAQGKLWVSAVKIGWSRVDCTANEDGAPAVVGVKMATGAGAAREDELSWNAITELEGVTPSFLTCEWVEICFGSHS